MNGLIALVVIVLVFVLLLLLVRRLPAGGKRPLTGHHILKQQIARSIESGRPIQVNLGRASLIAQHAATSLAALHILDYLVRSSSHNAPPNTNVGEATLLPAATISLRRSRRPITPQFLASEATPLAYASGMLNEASHTHPTALVTVGHHGTELALINYAGQQQEIAHLIGSDSPEGLAIAMTTTTQPFMGEDLLAVSAYLDEQPAQIASLYLQDIARWLLAGILLLSALYRLIT